MAAALNLSRSAMYSHLARLEAEELILRITPLDAGGGVVILRPAGAREAEERGNAAVVVPTVREASTTRHGRAVSWVAASAEVRGWEWLGPGDLRERAGWRPVREDGARHAPDLGIVRDAKRTAVEVELHAKSPARLRAILGGYRRLISAGDLDAVSYVVATERVAATVRRQAAEADVSAALSIGPPEAIVRGTKERGRATSAKSLS